MAMAETILIQLSHKCCFQPTKAVYVGSLTIDDGQGGVVTEVFEINVSSRQFNIEWKEKAIDLSWSDYLAEGEEWTQEILPGNKGAFFHLKQC